MAKQNSKRQEEFPQNFYNSDSTLNPIVTTTNLIFFIKFNISTESVLENTKFFIPFQNIHRHTHNAFTRRENKANESKIILSLIILSVVFLH